MKLNLLIDENLPAGLAEALGEHGFAATELGEQPPDEALWQFARREGSIILTKDADFFDKLAMQGAPPKIVWVRTGNMRRVDLIAFLVQQWQRIRALLVQADMVVVHRDRLETMKF